jgi:hypothetical protein
MPAADRVEQAFMPAVDRVEQAFMPAVKLPEETGFSRCGDTTG